MFELILYFILLAVFLSLVFHLFKYLKNFLRSYSLMRKLRAPKWTPVIGHLPEISCDGALLLKRLRKWNQELGPVFALAGFHLTVANVSGAEEFEIITSSMKHSKKGKIYHFMNKWLGQGLLTSYGSLWQVRRKILTPAFHFSILRDFVNVFNEQTDELVKKLIPEAGKSVNVIPFISQCTLSVIVETAMGSKLNLQNATDRSYVKGIYDLGNLLYYRLIRPWMHTFFFHITPKAWEERKIINTINTFTEKVIQIREENFQGTEIVTDENSEEYYTTSGKKKMVMLDLLLNAKLKSGIIDNKGIKDEVNTILFEGHDTTAMAISFALMLLACHREVQDLVYEEVIQKSDDNQKHFTMKELNDLKYTECVIKECLRLYPSVPFIARELEEDIKTSDEFIVPGNIDAFIHIYDIHRNTKHWPDPEKFDPERFLPENCLNRHPFAYVPFSAGPRNCVGQKFAMLEIKAVLAGILRNFILEPVDTPESIVVVPDIVLRPEHSSLLVKFVNRS